MLITNNRIKAVDHDRQNVIFEYKDYAAGGRPKQMQLDVSEFIRRFEQHILPKYFTKIRSYGYISNRNRKTNIAVIVACMKLPPHPQKVKIAWQVRLKERFNIIYNQCPCCKQQSKVLVGSSYKRIFITDE